MLEREIPSDSPSGRPYIQRLAGPRELKDRSPGVTPAGIRWGVGGSAVAEMLVMTEDLNREET